MSIDVLVIGSGPAGQKAAIQAAKAGARALLVERDGSMGGACVHHGTIPSKTLRETAAAISGFRRRTGGVLPLPLPDELQIASLMSRLGDVVSAHERFLEDQLRRNHVELWHGRARFLSPQVVEVESPHGDKRRVEPRYIVIATGSRPRTPPEIPVDHEHILDSDSILSMTWLPRSLTVLGAGVIACEYATIFAALGTRVTLIDRGERPLAFLDRELTDRFVQGFAGRFLGSRRIRSVSWDGLSEVVTTLEDGEQVRSEKLLCTLGRVANLDHLAVENAGLSVGPRGFLEVDEHCRTAVPHIYAAGDVIGPPSLATTSVEQGRRAVRHALGLPPGSSTEEVPIGIYTLPEMASVGLTEAQAIEQQGSAVVGRAPFDELARGQIAAAPDGLLKLVCDGEGRRVLGVQIIGEGACELIHLGQAALASGWEADAFVEHIFNFPTLAEAYRTAALDVVKRRASK